MSVNPPIFLEESEENTSEFVETKQLQPTSIASEDPLQNLCLASQEVLQKAQQSGRSKCLKCGSSRMFYCYTCYVPVENVPIEQIPLVKLPLKIDIIKHPNETDGKSTAIHAKLLAPEFVNIYTYPCIPEYEENDHEVGSLLQVELKTRKTCFWRHQKGKPDTFLSTIEAIYYFLVDYHTDVLKEKYKGQYDNLLFFYSFMYQLIKNAKCSGDKETRKLIN
ncbi:PREDICTED: DTW domain-containing protein 1 [Propithecus coquereli]|uniref:DTW domain-containing protein 1 n=1 Tax=Propithecus coquereli TaxID=379532 RepID=UPI00063FD2EB|nr:PREDICTED: DTW domain-containing protein 1 [Propithecus coquereli]